ncbi:acetaldehyde dehydrogenase (acetylating) [Candidatus Enterococcus murrayae]|uniref:Acetaldehyde dehydrogenase (Acetylating) n=1 Tax=Candidatus Enterococcus murrayae TaxID=2815321 RepID=A0ABS3HEN4_9ENTE|nr:acetaldehyde dehydrogenase (acetylating) [Enterococcus sp. MJM16]MBO0451916.1 acetaldehyde dehydrogenase (acetylating) [Enterococcus sp. MJM16]
MSKFDKDLCSVQEARDLTRAGHVAAQEFATFTQEQVDKILKNMKEAAEKFSVCLAKAAVDETGFGKVADKAYKNHAAGALLYEEIKDEKTVGIIHEDTAKGTFDVAEPVGLVMGIIPSTNPTSTVIFKAMIALKSRNAIVFAPHPAAAECTKKAADMMSRAAEAAGAPKGVISCVSTPTMASTNELMHAEEVKLIIATGGPGMVKAAYSSGKPAIGVGAGNSPAYIEKSADVKKAVAQIIASKTFDNGTICASEQSIICEESNEAEVIAELKAQGGYFMSEEETTKVCGLLFKGGGHAMNAKFVGRTPQVIAEAAGFTVPQTTTVLIGRQKGVGAGSPLSFEKLTTVLAFYTTKDWQEACQLSIDLLQNGIGHTMSIHTNDREIVLKFAAKPASRILVNTGGSQGGTGISTGLPISFTLGCGTFGGSSVSENVSPKHLLNIKKVAYGLKDVTSIVTEDTSFSHPELDGPISASLATDAATVEQSAEPQAENADDPNFSAAELSELAEVVRKVLTQMNA